ncbi:hypothetical protein HZH66_000623 [Vespula vulgaris]|uniref:Uncharacterized protein n=1 Tax=Vespula vulgaris TaxID=7454 RepID=A0A834KRU4_VESVU|nr:hypothetical protein HZH66_000623 [Vespula vulgaris]
MMTKTNDVKEEEKVEKKVEKKKKKKKKLRALPLFARLRDKGQSGGDGGNGGGDDGGGGGGGDGGGDGDGDGGGSSLTGKINLAREYRERPRREFAKEASIWVLVIAEYYVYISSLQMEELRKYCCCSNRKVFFGRSSGCRKSYITKIL